VFLQRHRNRLADAEVEFAAFFQNLPRLQRACAVEVMHARQAYALEQGQGVAHGIGHLLRGGFRDILPTSSMA
jgi:hypothetical protein